MILEELLYRANAHFTRSHKKDEVIVNCPFCVGTGLHEVYGKLGLNLKSGLAHCFRCGFRSRSIMRTFEELNKVYDLGLTFSDLLDGDAKSTEEQEDSQAPSPLGYPPGYEAFQATATDLIERKALKYLQSRGIDRALIKLHSIGYAGAGPYAWRVLFPVIWREEIYGCVGRDFSGRPPGTGQSPKYLNTPGIKLLCGAHRKAQVAIVTEGILDAISVEQALPSPKAIAVARLGSAITPNQLEQLSQYKRVCIFPDCDPAGVKGAIALGRECSQYNLNVWVIIPKTMDGSDPGSMDPITIRQYLSSAKPWSQAMEYRLRVSTTK